MARRVQTPEGNIMPGFHIVSKNPWIIHCYNFGNIFSPIKQLAPYLLRPARGRIHFVLTLNWSILPRRKFEAFNRAYHRHLRRYPHLVQHLRHLDFVIRMPFWTNAFIPFKMKKSTMMQS